MAKNKQPSYKTVDSLKHEDATRKNIPTAEYQSVVQEDAQAYMSIAYERRNKDLDPQLVWRGKDVKDWSDLVVHVPPLYIQEKVHPKVLIDDLLRQSKEQDYESGKIMADLFSDFNGIPKGVDKTEFYQHDQNWTNRMILGDSLQVMASLAEREGLRGQVQCVFFDPPYGIKFNSNFQWSTTSKDVKDGKIDHITREPEQVKAFRDTWRDGIHSYLTYLRDRLTVALDLLSNTGSIFVQIGGENVHRVRVLMDEVFGTDNFCAEIIFRKTARTASTLLATENDFLLWFAKDKERVKFHQLYQQKNIGDLRSYKYLVSPDTKESRMATKVEREDPSMIKDGWKLAQLSFAVSGDPGKAEQRIYKFRDKEYDCGSHRHWKTSNPQGLDSLSSAKRLIGLGTQLNYIRYFEDFPVESYSTQWVDTGSAGFSNSDPKVYVVQTDSSVIQRCLLMTTDPSDLVLDPTCGSGTTATVAEQWGRRWITIDTSRVSLALARVRIMGARYPFYILADSIEGQIKEAEITKKIPSTLPVYDNIRHGFVNDRISHITLKSIANNSEIEIICIKWQQKIGSLLQVLNKELHQNWNELDIPLVQEEMWSPEIKNIFKQLQEIQAARQKEIDASIVAKADYEFLYDKPSENKKKVRVAGPFTVESISPHRVLGVDENDELIDPLKQKSDFSDNHQSFTQMILDNLKLAGVQQAHKDDKIDFTSLIPWPGRYICAEGRYVEGDIEKRAAIFVGAEFGTAQRVDLVTAAREAGDAGFDVLIACAFNYEAHATEFNKLGRIPVLKARMNADLHMADDLKNTGKGNLFVIFGEPDIEILPARDNKLQVKINGVDVFHPNTGEVRSDGADGIACWFIDTDYNEESFFVRHAYFLGANDPYSSLKTTLKAEINKEAWDSLHSDTSRPFPKPTTGRIAVKVINHLGDEVMKVFKIT